MVVGAIKAASAVRINAATCYLSEAEVIGQNIAWKVKQIAETTWDASIALIYSKVKKNPCSLKELTIHLTDAKQQKACENALKQGQAIADGVTAD